MDHAGVSLRLLGAFELRVNGGPVSLPGRTQRLVALLALRGKVGRSRLAGSLWPETTENRALGCLRTAIWRVHQVAPGLVTSYPGTVELDRSAEVDVRRLIHSSQNVLTARPGVALTEPDLAAEDGELLPDWDDAWLTEDRERLRQLRLHVLEAQAERMLAEGSYGLAMEWALAAVRADSLRESAHRVVMRIHIAEGNVVEAQRAFTRCAAALNHELGLAPSLSTSRLLGSCGAAASGAALTAASMPGR